MDKHIELAKKLKQLADKGIGGEKINAEQMLNNLLKKHNLTLEDIEDEVKQDFFLQFTDPYQWKLFSQITALIDPNIPKYGKFPQNVIKTHRLRGNYMITCTVSQFIEIQAMHEFYFRLYISELDVFYTGFLHANKLLLPPDADQKPEDLSDEELEKELRIRKLSQSIQSEQFRKQLEQNNN